MNEKKRRTAKVLVIIIFWAAVSCLNFSFKIYGDTKELENQLEQTAGGERLSFLKEVAFYYKNTRPKKTVEYGGEALTLLVQAPDPTAETFIYNQLSHAHNLLGNYLKAREYAAKAAELARKKKDQIGLGEALFNQGMIEISMARYTPAQKLLAEAALSWNEVQYQKGIANIKLYTGAIYREKGDYSAALSNYLEAMETFETQKDNTGIAATQVKMGRLYLDMGHNEKAKELLLKAEKTLEEIDYSTYLVDCYLTLGTFHLKNQDNLQALDYFQYAYLASLLVGERKATAVSLSKMGQMNAYLREFGDSLEMAFENFNQSLEISREISLNQVTAETLGHLGQLYNHLKQQDKALTYLEEGLKLARQYGDERQVADNYFLLVSAYLDKGDYKNAYYNCRQHIITRKRFNSDTSRRKFNEVETSYQVKLQESKIKLLQKTNHVSQLELSKYRTLRTSFIIIFLLTMVLLVFFYSRYRLKKKMNGQLSEKHMQLQVLNQKLSESESHLKELNHTKDKFFSIIAHDLKNPLHSFIDTSELLSDSLQDMSREQAGKFIGNLNTTSRQLYTLLENLLQWSQSQTGTIAFSPGGADLAELAATALFTLSENARDKEITLGSQIQPGTNVYCDRNMVLTILRNLVSNAVKFTGSGGSVNISASGTDKEEWLEVAVIDTGTGIAEQDIQKLFKVDSHFSLRGTAGEKGTGLGLIICKEFVDAHGGQIRVESRIQQGTTFYFTLPMVKPGETGHGEETGNDTPQD
jgi:signal transduction histidine kinase